MAEALASLPAGVDRDFARALLIEAEAATLAALDAPHSDDKPTDES